jgi:8-oxo-dGTP diphosphatase
MNKPTKYAVAVVLKVMDEPDKFLVVRRPKDDPDLGGSWGLPAVSLQAGELPEEAARRICQEKLHCNAVPTRLIGAMFQKRNSYDILLMDIEMALTRGEADYKLANTEHTAYVDQKWTSDPKNLMKSAQKGSCCSSIFLTDRGLLDKNDWVTSLEGSDSVG